MAMAQGLMQQNKPRRVAPARRNQTPKGCLALARLEARIGFVDDVNPALAADQLVVTMALEKRLERIANFHGFNPIMGQSPLKGHRISEGFRTVNR